MSLEELHHAIEYGEAADIRRLATRDNVNKIHNGLSAVYATVAYEPLALRDDPDTVSFLVGLSADPNYQTPFEPHSTPLLEACFGGRGRVAKVLVEAGANVGWLSDADSVLGAAARGGLVDIVSLALEKRGADLVRGRTTPLIGACMRDHLDVCRLLLSHGADPSRTLYGHSPLTAAIEHGSLHCFEYLLSIGVEVEREHVRVLLDADMAPELREDVSEAFIYEIPRFEPWSKQGAFRQIAMRMRELLAEVAGDLGREAESVHRCEYLERALSERDTSKFESFFVASPSLKEELRELQALELAVESGQPRIVTLLIDNGFEIDSDEYEMSPLLTTAIENEDEEMVDLLLAAGADPNEWRHEEGQGGRSWSPLALAMRVDHDALVERLLRAGADPEAADFDPDDATGAEVMGPAVEVRVPSADSIAPLPVPSAHLFAAIAARDHAKVVALLGAGADINHVKIRGVIRCVESPLSAAIAAGNPQIVDLLLARGARLPPGEGLFARAEQLSMRKHLRGLGFLDTERCGVETVAESP